MNANGKANGAFSIENDNAKHEAPKIENLFPEFEIKHVIIDFSCVNFIDTQAINGILQVSYSALNSNFFKIKAVIFI